MWRRLVDEHGVEVAETTVRDHVRKAETSERAERRERRRLIDARFPALKRLEDFRFTDNPKVPQATIAALAEGSWIADRESVILIGDSGTGKTHLATALAICACQQGRRVRFSTLAALANELQEAQSRKELARVVGRCARTELLRFLHVRGYTPRSLAESVPGVAGWRETTIPPTMPQADIEQLLESCDRSTVDGARDHAMLVLLARLGLRSIEIARLRLEDLDWRAGDLLVRGKARRDDRLPIPDDVGAALAGYLALRGRQDSRSVFLTLRAPRRPIRADLVGDVVQRHCRQAGVPHVGPHRLRHTLATEMLAAGAALSEISQVLRHSDLATTAIYAKVDLGRLRQVARPWPGAAR